MEIPENLNGIQYLKKTISSFNLIDFFNYFNLTTKDACVKKFRDVMTTTATLDPKREQAMVSFAKTFIENEFSILDGPHARKHFTKLSADIIKNKQEEATLTREIHIANTNLDVLKEVYNKPEPTEKKHESSSDADVSSISDNNEDNSSYVERDSTLSSDASERQRMPTTNKRKATLYTDYLVSSNSNNTISLDENSTKWVLPSGFNLSEAFIKRRNQLVEECKGCEKKLKQDEELAINGIILVDSNAISTIINDDHYVEACNELKDKYLKYKINCDARVMSQLSSFCQLMTSEDFDDALSLINNSSLPPRIKAILYSLHRTYYKGYNIEQVNESTIVKDGVVPFLDNYFPNTKQYITVGADQVIPETRKRFVEMDPSLYDHVRKADFSVISTQSSHSVFALEAKSEKCKDKSKGDLIKMARYMKDILDSAAMDNYKNVCIVGSISNGTLVTSYIMEQSHDYLYTLYKQGEYHIPLNHYDMFRIMPIFSILEQQKNIVLQSIRELSRLQHERDAPVELKRLKTYHTPVRLPAHLPINLSTEAVRRASRKLTFK